MTSRWPFRVFNVSVRLLSGEVRGPFRFHVLSDGDVWALQLRLCIEMRLEWALARRMVLICDGQLLRPRARLSACNVPDDATLQLIWTPAKLIR
eukprot:CAMPEP_0168435820 /NCGR_PEP_ID=MMETSP0228-20121227/40613_1 /TAXON_ID=133427 /ORGANISM="Protoceratium reticulatum, Strain CCCM 535 (=CCMP 1889)" /LENGTH=93 /DNA_ID=CAMNT_0008450009 /DNA_START=1 /DNA_END=278 /DNA_ORIENTATION=+